MDISKIICYITLIITAIGAIDWLLTAFGYNLIPKLTGQKDPSNPNKIIYTIIGICGIITLFCKLSLLSSSSSSN